MINYLHAHNFDVYIVNGGGQDFMRAFTQNTYQIPPEKVIGSTSKKVYQYNNGKPVLIKLADSLYVSD